MKTGGALLLFLLAISLRDIATADDTFNVVEVQSPEIPYEGSLYELACPGSGNLEYFLLHGTGEVMSVDYESEELLVASNGSVIFKAIRMEHEGVHLCVKNEAGNMYAHEAHVRVRPTPSTDLWNDMYESMFWTGMLAALVIATLFALFCLVSKKRWRPVKGGSARPDDRNAIIADGYDNPAMQENQDDPDEVSIKM